AARSSSGGPRTAEALAEGLARAPCGLGVETGLEGDVAELVVSSTLLCVGENGIGLRDLLEALLGSLVSGIHVGMVLARELAIRLGDRVLAGVSRDAEDLVGILAAVAPAGARRHVRASPDTRAARADRRASSRRRNRLRSV